MKVWLLFLLSQPAIFFFLPISFAFSSEPESLFVSRPAIAQTSPDMPSNVPTNMQPETSPEQQLTTGDQLLQSGIQQFQNAQFREASESWQAALEIYRNPTVQAAFPQKSRMRESAALSSLGLAYTNLGLYEEAIALHQQSLALARDIGDKNGEGRALGNLGSAYFFIGQYRQAAEIYQQRLKIAQETQNRTGETAVLNNLGETYHQLGQYQQAIDLFQRSLDVARDISDRANESRALGNLGNTYRSLGQYQQAIALYEQVLSLTRAVGDVASEGRTLGNLGNAHSNLGQYQQAIDFYSQALKMAQTAGDLNSEGIALNNLGNAYLGMENSQQAIALFQQALEIASEISDRAGEGVALGNLGTAYYNSGQHLQAIDFFQQDLAIAREIEDMPQASNALHNLGLALHANADWSEAEEALFSAIEVLENLRLGGLSEDRRISLIETQLEAFQSLQRTLVAQGKTETALEIAERGRARVFLEELALRLETESLAPLEPSLSLPDTAQIQHIAKQQNATLVQYSILPDEAIYIWVVQPSGEIYFRQVSLQAQAIDLSQTVTNARSSIGAFRSIVVWGENTSAAATAAAPHQLLQQLHSLLIDPIADLLPANPDHTVIFIPQNELFLVPFAALQDKQGSALIERHTPLVSPSIQVLESTHTQKTNVKQANLQDRLVIGNPTISSLAIAPGEPSIQLDPLPGAEQEAIDIAALLDTEALIGSAATKSSVVQKMPNARIIHLATHGLLDEFQGLNGGIVLAADGTGEFNDGLLTAAEIAQMKLNAELVVLSACNTGQGRITGDGVVGLSRSLILAGVPSVVVSLWAVPDQPTGELMVEFYQQMEETDNKAQALRQAMLNIREKYPDPVAWAGFTLIGEAE